MSPLERAARALAKQHHQPQFDQGNSSLHAGQYADRYWRDYVRQARAVLEAIREPSEDMIQAGEAWQQHSSDVENLFSEMIKVAIHGRDS